MRSWARPQEEDWRDYFPRGYSEGSREEQALILLIIYIVLIVSFGYLLDELVHGRYTRHFLPFSLQHLPAPVIPTFPWVSRVIPPEVQSDQAVSPAFQPTLVPRARCAAKGDEAVVNAHPLARLQLVANEHTLMILLAVVLPVVNGGRLFKRGHLGGTCFDDCPRAASHRTPNKEVVDKVIVLLVTKCGDLAAHA